MPAPAGSEQTFINDLAKDTGLDPRVIEAWVQVEGAYAPGGTGGYNFLNIRESTSRSGVPLAGTSPKGFALFHSAGQAAQESAWWINNMSNYQGIRRSASMSPESQLAAIAASPWDSGHYNGGKTLFAAYSQIVTSAGGAVSWLGNAASTATNTILNPVGTALAGAGDVAGHVPVVGGVLQSGISVAEAPVKIAEDLGQVMGFLFNPENWLRVGFILAGGVLTLGGLFVLARSVGATQAAASVAFPELAAAEGARAAAGRAATGTKRAAKPRTRTQTRTKTVYVMDEEANRRERVRRRAAAAEPSNDIPF